MSIKTIALLTVLTIGLFAPALPPSRMKPGLSSFEQALVLSILPLLGLAAASAGLGAALGFSRHVRVARILVVLALILLNLSAVFGSWLGHETLGLWIPGVATVILLVLLCR